MLENLSIKNIALIDSLELTFGDNLNILSGETGAGKSIIIDSLNFLLGEKPKTTLIRRDQEFAEVTGVFNIKNSFVLQYLSNLGIIIDDDNLLILNRKFLKTGKITNRINGEIVTVGMVKDIGNILVDVHGQHQNMSLFDKNNHIDLLDKFCGNNLDSLKDELKIYFTKYKEINTKINSIKSDDVQAKLDIFNFQVEEIRNAELKPNEEFDLTNEKKSLQSFYKIQKNLNLCVDRVYSSNDGTDSAVSYLHEIAKVDQTLEELYKRLENVKIELSDIMLELKSYKDNIDYDPYRLDEIERRLSTIYNLKRKYGTTIEEILDFCTETESKIEALESSSNDLKHLQEQKQEVYAKCINISNELSKVRKRHCKELEQLIENALNDVGMKDAKFEISIKKSDYFGFDGFDSVEFLISPNQGENLKPLAEIASGGEMSRLVFSLKTIFATLTPIETYVFDEIETGVSGRTAQKVAEKLKELSKKNQIICITHLAQIASMANSHYLIEKKTIDNTTLSNVTLLNKEQTINEIARLIGGAAITDKTLKAASEMLELAKEL